MPTRKTLLTEGTALLKAAGVSEAGLNCQWLLAHLLKTDRLSMLADGGAQAPATNRTTIANVLTDAQRLFLIKIQGCAIFLENPTWLTYP